MNLRNIFQYSLRNPNAMIPFIVSLPKFVRLYGRLLRDPRVPLGPKIIFTGGLIYAISPIDLVPDFIIPIIGWIFSLYSIYLYIVGGAIVHNISMWRSTIAIFLDLILITIFIVAIGVAIAFIMIGASGI